MRKLTKKEINQLTEQGCRAQDWALVTVHSKFDASHCEHVHFFGPCQIGDNRGGRPSDEDPNYEEPYRISHARLIDCRVGDRVIIEGVRDSISHYDIGDDVVIRDVATLRVTGQTTFGNGLLVEVLNETGGREVPICDILTAQTAYMLAMYRHDKELQSSLSKLVEEYTDTVRSDRGVIGEHAQVKHCGMIVNVKVGPHSSIVGSSVLENGSVNSTQLSPTQVGYGVICRDFIFSAGSVVADGSNVSRCFIGQGCSLTHLFSAHDSLFFANCQCENGEACAVLAGPFTVTMHKSSLLIAGYYSFLNAGSGSNQSNHLYKLGPIHQGVVERGSKTTSDSYILWPSRIGAFSLIMGRHTDHIDSSDFPFSYLIESSNQTYLVPGVNLRSVGTIRDTKKWPKRDKRHPAEILDCINFNLLSPYTVGKMYKGWHKLKALETLLGSADSTYIYHDMHIRHRSLVKGCHYYEMGIVKFIGNSLIQRIQDGAPKSKTELLACLQPTSNEGLSDWLDLAGMIAPRKLIRILITQIKTGALKSLQEVNDSIRAIHNRYYEVEWHWAYDLLLRWYDLSPDKLTVEKVVEIIKEWKDRVITLDEYLLQDAHKEFEMLTQVGFGIDLNGEYNKRIDFEQVRGSYEDNAFVAEVHDHIRRKGLLGDTTLKQIAALPE